MANDITIPQVAGGNPRRGTEAHNAPDPRRTDSCQQRVPEDAPEARTTAYDAQEGRVGQVQGNTHERREKGAVGLVRAGIGDMEWGDGMVDREKVIKGLKCHVNGHPHTRCHKCPYWGTGPHGASECSDMVAGALALLKAQEPRLMTWQEIVDTAPQMPFIWLESKENNDRVFQSILFKTWLWDSTATIITVMTQGWLFEGYHVDYGKTWRCWTSRPTDEQMEALKWE